MPTDEEQLFDADMSELGVEDSIEIQSQLEAVAEDMAVEEHTEVHSQLENSVEEDITSEPKRKEVRQSSDKVTVQ
jgi:hypothetical protein